MSPFLSRPLRTYAEAAYDMVKASSAPGMRFTPERHRLFEIMERELKRQEQAIIKASRVSR